MVAPGLGPAVTFVLVLAAVGDCPLCPPAAEPWDSSLGVTSFPRKAAKKQPRVEQTATCVLERRGCRGALEYLIVQRPSSGTQAGGRGGKSTWAEQPGSAGAVRGSAPLGAPPAGSCPSCPLSPGLLAGLWEFPSVPLAPGLQQEQQREVLRDHLQAWTGQPVAAGSLQFMGEVSVGRGASPTCSVMGDAAREGGPCPLLAPLPHPALLFCQFQCLPLPLQVVHVFSHIHQTYVVYSLPLDGDVTLDLASSPSRWVTEEEFHASAVSTAMKKVFRESWDFPALHLLGS